MPGSLVGRVLAGRYRLDRAIGEGGMGAVLEATDLELGRRIAVKVLLLELGSDPKMVARFQQEALATARLSSPNIVAVTDFHAEPGEPPFLVMELLAGESLRDRMKRTPKMPVQAAVRIAVQLLGALAVAHAAGIVHRDIKPPNVFLVKTAGRDEELVKLLDFGIAKVARDLAKVHTTQGTVMGTPVYFAPEQLLGGEIDGRTDVHAVGVVLFEMLAGRRPFDADNAVDLAAAILHAAPPPLVALRSDVPPALADAIESALTKERTLRPTAEELAARLAPFAADAPASVAIVHVDPVRSPPPSPPRPPVRRRSIAPWIALGVVAAGAAGAAAYATSEDVPVVVASRVTAPVDASIDAAADAIDAATDATPDALVDDAPDASAARANDDEARSTRLYQARYAGIRGEHETVRDLLYAFVMDGGADDEEQRLLREACKALRDRACAAKVRELYAPTDAATE